MPHDLLSRPLIEIARDLREKWASARELIEAAIARQERFGEGLHAYSLWAPEQTRAAANAADAAFAAGVSAGPLQGLPVSLKDLFAAAGHPCFAGSSRRLPADPWERDGPLVATLRRQLGVIMGKTQMVEFAFGGTGLQSVGRDCSSFGRRFLEWCRGQSAGRLGFACIRQRHGRLGSHSRRHDRQRRPEGYDQALVHGGYCTTVFYVQHAGIAGAQRFRCGLWFAALDPAGIDPVGFIARAGTRDLTGIRIGIGDPFLWHDCDSGIAETVQEAVDVLVRAGAVARNFVLPQAEAAYGVFLDGGLSAIELRSFLDRELPEWLDQLDPVIAPSVRNAEALGAREYLARVARLKNLAQEAAPLLDALTLSRHQRCA